MSDANPMLLVVINIGTAIFVVGLAFILNGVKDQMKQFHADLKQFSADLKDLNDAVLGKYSLRAEAEVREEKIWQEFHKLRTKLQDHETKIAVLSAVSHQEFAEPHRPRSSDKE